MFTFDIVRGGTVRAVLEESRSDVVDIVEATYVDHHAGRSVNPRSHFLRFPEKPSSRIIALPAHLGGEHATAGIKWIASFPDNVRDNVHRASAVLILNDYATGFPVACLEASQISAARTAASAVLGAEQLTGGRRADRVLLVGAGVLGRTVVDYLAARGWEFGQVAVTDLVTSYADSLRTYSEDLGYRSKVVEATRPEMSDADLIVFVTTAGEPWVFDPDTFAAGQTVLNISLRDLSPDIVAGARNIVDDVDHCLTADTSPHLAEQRLGHRDFVDGTLAQLLTGERKLDNDRPLIFSPFGLGVLDLAVGRHVHRVASELGLTVEIPDFFGETERWA
ncbi:2,3-diaminopropionate biosynthesis protein SbnB [Pseudonocardia sp. ICBG601]|uniref:2,3-diaminopropionate biosynthesis protein SbnB n=1 Tax=Pseudonocardia sp. ICBG601 TaxID=2846759 RepID=UPI001CF61D31|nr:2,3-diaminopropionate biosynthesis protein SbnB [Pseudonocardia sp. ICBG601]